MNRIIELKARLFDIEQTIRGLETQYQQVVQELQTAIREEQNRQKPQDLQENEK